MGLSKPFSASCLRSGPVGRGPGCARDVRAFARLLPLPSVAFSRRLASPFVALCVCVCVYFSGRASIGPFGDRRFRALGRHPREPPLSRLALSKCVKCERQMKLTSMALTVVVFEGRGRSLPLRLLVEDVGLASPKQDKTCGLCTLFGHVMKLSRLATSVRFCEGGEPQLHIDSSADHARKLVRSAHRCFLAAWLIPVVLGMRSDRLHPAREDDDNATEVGSLYALEARDTATRLPPRGCRCPSLPVSDSPAPGVRDLPVSEAAACVGLPASWAGDVGVCRRPSLPASGFGLAGGVQHVLGEHGTERCRRHEATMDLGFRSAGEALHRSPSGDPGRARDSLRSAVRGVCQAPGRRWATHGGTERRRPASSRLCVSV